MNLIKKIGLLLLFLSSLFSKDLTQLYLNGNSEELFKVFEEQLISKEYWEKQLEFKDVTYGYYENNTTLLVACKSCMRLKQFHVRSDGKVIKINDFNATFGKVKGDKYLEGDLKTPIGVYEFVDKLQGKKLDQYYGPFAFVTNYPNTFDKVQKKNGYGIWLHGYPLNGNRDDLKTKGCIAVENDLLQSIEKSIEYKKSVLIVNEEKEKVTNKNEILNILVNLFKWRKAWKESDLEEYMRFYSNEFIRDDGLNIERFRDLKRRIFEQNKYVELYFKDLEISPYPNSIEKRVFRIKFNEEYRSNIHRFNGSKEIFVDITNGDFKILIES